MIFVQTPPAPVVGQAVPDVAFETRAGKTIKLRSLRGKVVVLIFTGYPCQPCRALEPKLDTYASSHRGVVFLEVSVDDPTRFAILKTLRKNAPTELVHDKYSADRRRMAVWQFGDVGTPTIFVIDRNGKFASRGNTGPDNPLSWLDYRIGWAKGHS